MNIDIFTPNDHNGSYYDYFKNVDIKPKRNRIQTNGKDIMGDYIKVDLKEIGADIVDWIDLDCDRALTSIMVIITLRLYIP